MMTVLEMLWCVVMLIVVSRVMIRVCDMVWLKPKRIRSTLSKQGIGGPKSSSFFYGNLKEIQSMMEEPTVTITTTNSSSSSDVQPPVSHHQWLRSTFLHLQIWTRRYGKIYMFSTGTHQHLVVHEAELIKELKLHKLNLGTPSYLSKAVEPMLGNGIIKANGQHWSFQKKLIAPEFFLHKVKGIAGLMEECTMAMISTWERRLNESSRLGGAAAAEFMVDQDLRGLSADIISRYCFGSSYSQGKNIFAKLANLQEALILKVVNKGRQENGQKNLLQMIIESAATDSTCLVSLSDFVIAVLEKCLYIYIYMYVAHLHSSTYYIKTLIYIMISLSSGKFLVNQP